MAIMISSITVTDSSAQLASGLARFTMEEAPCPKRFRTASPSPTDNEIVASARERLAALCKEHNIDDSHGVGRYLKYKNRESYEHLGILPCLSPPAPMRRCHPTRRVRMCAVNPLLLSFLLCGIGSGDTWFWALDCFDLRQAMPSQCSHTRNGPWQQQRNQ
jgi:hypothetical protein